MKNVWKVVCLITFVIVAFILGFALKPETTIKNDDIVTNCNQTHIYTRPILDCLNTDVAFGRFSDTNKRVNDYIVSEIDKGDALRISVFFRDLKTNRWYGVNQTEMFSPGSLLKLPLAMAYIKYAELSPSIMQQQLSMKSSTPSANNLEHFKPKSPISPNTQYTVHNLIGHMISDSDNDATNLLYTHLDSVFYNDVMQDLGVNIPLSSEGGIRSDFYTTSSYSSILRQLYNSSYLSLDSSNLLLSMMASSTFDNGIVAGIPDSVKVAHKFGEGTAMDPSTGIVVKNELHDCGIVYKDSSPYILCVMTEGLSFDTLSSIISHISDIVWRGTNQ